MQSKDLNTVKILSHALNNHKVDSSDIQTMYPDAPMKLIYAKIYILERNGWVETYGPSCQFCVLTPRGIEWLNSELNKLHLLDNTIHQIPIPTEEN